MSNKISTDAARALILGSPFARSNTSVVIHGDGESILSLHGNPLAKIDTDGNLWLSDGGYPSMTTNSRLRAVMEAWPANEYITVRYIDGSMWLQNNEDKTVSVKDRYTAITTEFRKIDELLVGKGKRPEITIDLKINSRSITKAEAQSIRDNILEHIANEADETWCKFLKGKEKELFDKGGTYRYDYIRAEVKQGEW